VYNNTINQTRGKGMIFDGSNNTEVYNNTILNFLETANMEYPGGESGFGIRIRDYAIGPNYNLKVHNNYIYAHIPAASQYSDIYGLKLTEDPAITQAPSHNLCYNNTVNVSTEDASKPAYAISFDGYGLAAGGLVFNNTLESNNVNVLIPNSNGYTTHVSMQSDTLIKGPNPVSYKTFKIGYWIYQADDSHIIDARYENGASASSLQFIGTGHCSLYFEWFLTVHVQNTLLEPIQNAVVTIKNQSLVTIYTGTTDANGNIPRQTLPEYYYLGTLPTPHLYTETPYTVTVTHGSDVDTETVDLTYSKTITVTL
jgi:hypothetical protein